MNEKINFSILKSDVLQMYLGWLTSLINGLDIVY